MGGDKPAADTAGPQDRGARRGRRDRAPRPFDADQVQPASLDLRLGRVAYRVRASFLPGPTTRSPSGIDRLKLHELDLTDGALLEPGRRRLHRAACWRALRCRPISPPRPTRNPRPAASTSSPASSPTARREFDTIPAGYRGPLYLEISPRTFPVVVRAGSRLSQIRFRRGNARLDDAELRRPPP